MIHPRNPSDPSDPSENSTKHSRDASDASDPSESKNDSDTEEVKALKRLIQSKPPPRPNIELVELDEIYTKEYRQRINQEIKQSQSTKKQDERIEFIMKVVQHSFEIPSYLIPTPGVTYRCERCKQVLYSDNLSTQLHEKSCTKK